MNLCSSKRKGEIAIIPEAIVDFHTNSREVFLKTSKFSIIETTLIKRSDNKIVNVPEATIDFHTNRLRFSYTSQNNGTCNSVVQAEHNPLNSKDNNKRGRVKGLDQCFNISVRNLTPLISYKIEGSVVLIYIVTSPLETSDSV